MSQREPAAFETSHPAVTVVVPCRNGASRLPRTLEALGAQRVAGTVEVVVVDDGSDDPTSEVASTTPLPWGAPTVVRHPAPRGRAAACNSGLEAARGDLVAILDDDMTLEPGSLAAHAAFHAAHPGSAALGRIVLAPAERPSSFARFLLREERLRERRLLASRDDLPFELCLTGHFSAPRALLARIGGYDAAITRYGFEDIELGYRLRTRGVRIAYLPDAVSVHRAYMTDLRRYLERHLEAGSVARQLAERYPEGPFREYLRVDGPRELGLGKDPAGLVALRLSNRLLLRRPIRRALGSSPGFALLRAALRAGEALRLDRAVHFGYHVARDLRYFEGYFGERAPAGPA